MYEKLTFQNENGESVEFSRNSPYHVNFKDVDGLSDIRNTIYSINSMGQDGDTYISNRIESRDIEIVGYLHNRDKAQTQELRRKLNHVLNPQYSASLVYEFGDFKRVIDCRVDNAPRFTKPPIFEQFTIQLRCLNPFWREETETREDIAVWVGGMEFPLEISADGWEVGFRQPSLIVNVFNKGDVNSGIRVDFRALGIVRNPLLLNVNTNEFIRINITMEAGDILSVSTGYGQKKVTLRRNNITSDAFRYIDVDSTYLQLTAGDNLFKYDSESNVDNLEVSIYHNNYYLGV